MTQPRKKRPLTERQRQILEFIAGEIQLQGRPPTLREIGRHFNIGSTNAVRTALNALEKKGHLRRKPYLSRGIELTRRPLHLGTANVSAIPVVGRVAAGQPLLAVENLDGELLIDGSLLRGGNCFALKVKGQSMVEAGIRDGDFVIANPDLPVETGEIVVALIEDEATVKRYYPDKGHIRLEPANPHFEPIVIDREYPGFSIAGKIIGLYRKY